MGLIVALNLNPKSRLAGLIASMSPHNRTVHDHRGPGDDIRYLGLRFRVKGSGFRV